MIPEKMRAVVVDEPKSAVVREVTTPVPKPGEILIELKKCLLCTWEQRIFGGSGAKLPFIPGHEASGVVAYVPGETTTSFKAGDKVVIKTLNHCGHCEECYRGNDNQCMGTFKQRSYDGISAAGGLAQYIAMEVPRVFLAPNQDISYTTAAFTEPVACCVRSMEQADIKLSEDVVIVGAGIMGQLHNVLAKMRGARTIIAEPDASRRKLALEMGADIAFDPMSKEPVAEVKALTNGRGAHVIFMTATMAKLAEVYIQALTKMGRIVYYGSFHPDMDITINPNHIHYSEKTITGSYSPNVRGFWTASRLLSYGLIDVSRLLSAEYTMNDCQKAFEHALDPLSFRICIDLE